MSVSLPVHPRACGEHRLLPGRGRRQGFIPARAGNTPLPAPVPSATSVHPRACGEHAVGGKMNSTGDGSSPRVRGTHHVQRRHSEHVGSSPARAGNTLLLRFPTPQPPVHPRACGEHHSSPVLAVLLPGSSPRVRGTHLLSLLVVRGQRFIPARAGNTRANGAQAGGNAVHPRACGEHGIGGRGNLPGIGSSPRVRGTPSCRRLRHAPTRFIPARAGNTSRRQGPHRLSAVHPRACGEHPLIVNPGHVVSGSSPRVRGTHSGLSGVSFSTGSSPRVRGTRPPPGHTR